MRGLSLVLRRVNRDARRLDQATDLAQLLRRDPRLVAVQSRGVAPDAEARGDHGKMLARAHRSHQLRRLLGVQLHDSRQVSVKMMVPGGDTVPVTTSGSVLLVGEPL